MDLSLALRECQPRISTYSVSTLKLEPRNYSRDLDSSKLCLRSPIPMDSNDNLGRKQVRCNFLYRNLFHSSFKEENYVVDTSMKKDTETEADLEADAITLTTSTASRRNIPAKEQKDDVKQKDHLEKMEEQEHQQEQQQEQEELMEQQELPEPLPTGSFVRPKSVPDSKFSGFLRVLARSLEHCSGRIAAGFGLSRQQTAWYKHCWHTPGSQSQRIHGLGCQSKSLITVPTFEARRSLPSSTTL
ncbi:hypothetical protein KR054_005011 [Drosophila jambulina]|nr:hypothetical protein KR054_005011 [Drosophila jambulina]